MNLVNNYRWMLLVLLCIFCYFSLLFMVEYPAQAAQVSPRAAMMDSTATSTLTLDVGAGASITVTHQIATTFVMTVTPGITLTLTPTVTATIEPTPTLSPTPTPTSTPAPQLLPFLVLPLISKHPTQTPLPPMQPVLALQCNANRVTIPDNSLQGVSSELVIADNRTITDLDLVLNIEHSYIGDLTVRLTHADTGRSALVIDRPGYPDKYVTGCASENIAAILDDDFSALAENKCFSGPAAIAGTYIPYERLSTFIGDQLGGAWILTVTDNYHNDTGSVQSWCLAADVSPSPPEPTPLPTYPNLPSQKILSGLTGQPQALPLDCESRSAIDWARYFGKNINEFTFFNQLPEDANPDKGFVGDVNGDWGQIPPNDYGVHAEPVAALLRSYNLSAYAHKQLSYDGLRAEIAAGRPVIVWIIGSIGYGIPVYFTPPDGLHTIVARYEHTVVVTGYTDSSVYYLNGGTIYSSPVTQFLDSWSALGNMAITTQP